MTRLPATLTQLQHQLRGGQLSVAESLRLQRERFARRHAAHGCVVRVLKDSSQAEAENGALRGVALAHKDIFDLAGWAPGLGHSQGRSDPGRQPAQAIARLTHAGATQLATLGMAEYACGSTGHNPRMPPITNPLGLQLAVGGSSSGSAVAVASELVYGALGTDTAGSVRIPAATCALLGLKTTHGLIPTQGVQPLAPSLDSVGLLTRSADDARAMLAALTAPGDLRAAVAAPRLKAWLPADRLHASVAAALKDFAARWPACELVDLLPEQPMLSSLSEIVLHHEAAATHRAALCDGTLSAGVEAVALPGLAIAPHWYQAALRDRAQRARDFFTAHLQHHDLLMLPALPQTLPTLASVTPGAPGFDVQQLLALHSFMGFVNYLGFPAMVIPLASDADGLPISAQFIARPFEELTLLAFAHKVELAHFGSDGFTRRFTHLQD
jgi:Asp-tRNA(Asn)/Glu-tRNA(Gln) amidotransferase A subunit family amidase